MPLIWCILLKQIGCFWFLRQQWNILYTVFEMEYSSLPPLPHRVFSVYSDFLPFPQSIFLFFSEHPFPCRDIQNPCTYQFNCLSFWYFSNFYVLNFEKWNERILKNLVFPFLPWSIVVLKFFSRVFISLLCWIIKEHIEKLILQKALALKLQFCE